ncbi:MAG: Stp1/IreP family PP2C-type Ser/Thr phosphatase [Gaiellaceae bacterium]
MKIGQHASLTDTGRKRLRNEDAVVVSAPLFAVADGMGGAKGGQLAAQLAAGVFSDHASSSGIDGETRLRALVVEANRQVFNRAQSDPSLAGMGTTVTAVVLEDDHLAIVQVGDSRAYRLRGGVLDQLTEDHSLVAELVRSGRLTREEAALHPQRAVITRALGTDPTVAADVFVTPTQPGDVFLLCTDGLTTMVGDGAIEHTLLESKDAQAAARALVRAANQAGGDDNVSVVIFEIVEDAWADPEPQILTAPDEDTLTSLEPVALLSGGVGEPRETVLATAQAGGRGARPRSILPLLLTALALALAGVVVVGAVWGSKRAYFVGADEQGYITVYQGVPWDITEGVKLYREIYVSPLRAPQLTPEERAELFDHDLAGEDVARERIAELERLVVAP